MRALIFIMTPILILTFILASRFVSWEKLKGVDKNAHKHLSAGTKLLREGKNYKAINAFTQAIEIEPKFAEAYIKRGIAYYYLAYYEKAIEDYNQTLSLKQYTADAYASRADTYRALNDFSNAITDYTASLKQRKNALVMSKRAEVYLEIGEIDKALEDYHYIVKHRPSAIAYYDRGSAYYEKYLLSKETDEDLKLALADFDKSIELQPLFAIALIRRGDIHAYMDQPKSKESDYARAVDILTDAINNWKENKHQLITFFLWRATAYEKNNNTDEAKEDIEKTYGLFREIILTNFNFSAIL